MRNDKKYILTLSAYNNKKLAEEAEDVLTCLERNKYRTGDLADICYTLQIGREVMPYRVAFLIESIEDLKEKLSNFQDTLAGQDDVYLGKGEAESLDVMKRCFPEPDDAKQYLKERIDAKDYSEIAKIWAVSGYEDWNYFYKKEGTRPYTISLPTYRFERNSYWAPAKMQIEPEENLKKLTKKAGTLELESGKKNETILYEEVWEECKTVVQEPDRQLRTVLVFVPEEYSVRIKACLTNMKEANCQFIWVSKGTETKKLGAGEYTLAGEKAPDFQTLFSLIQSAHVTVDGMLYLWNYMGNKEFAESYYESVIQFVKGLANSHLEVQKVVLSGGYQKKRERCYSEALVSLEKCLPMLLPNVSVRAVLLPFKSSEIQTFCCILWKELNSNMTVSVSYENGKRKVRTLQEKVLIDRTSQGLVRQGIYCITGGMGRIGTLLASWLIRVYDATVILLGRRNSNEVAEKMEQFASYDKQEDRTKVSYLQADVCEYNQLETAFLEVSLKYGKVNGIFHAAGIEGVGNILNTDIQVLHQVLAPKVSGTENVCRVAEEFEADFLCFFSSSSAMLGDFGNCAYSLGNRFMMGMAKQGRNRKVINWPLWKDGGMGKGDREAQKMYLKSSGQTMLESETAFEILDSFLASDLTELLVMSGDRTRIESFLMTSNKRGEKERDTTYKGNQIQKPKSRTRRKRFRNDWTLEECVLHEVKDATAKILQIPMEELEGDDNLADYGYDSITLAEFASVLSERLKEKITPDIFFSYPTLDRLACYLLETYQEHIAIVYEEDMEEEVLEEAKESEKLEEIPVPKKSGTIEEFETPVAIVGISGRFPGASNPEELWQLIKNGREVIAQVPKSRREWWEGKDASQYDYRMGYLEGIDQFDPLFFEISPSEAETMDPQQRLLLEEIWKAFEDAGYGRTLLDSERVGVFVGAEDGDYKTIIPNEVVITSNNSSMLSARIAYLLNLTGPNMTINTACSSGLSAVHQAVRSIQNGECDSAIAAGASLEVTSSAFDSMQRAGMLAEDRRCYAFDTRANGMVPAEAIATVVLKKLSKAKEDGNYIYGVITGSGMNYDGKTNGITAPSGRSQKELLTSVYNRAHINPEDIGLILAHGTGTKLGDPIEMNALTAAFAEYTDKRGFCAVESVKSNIGHSLSASGVVSLLVLLKAMQKRMIPPQINGDEKSEYINWEASPFYLNKHQKVWEPNQRNTRMGAVSAFGMGGTNVHLVVESYENPMSDGKEKPSYLLTVSAKTKEALEMRCKELADYLEQDGSEESLTDVAFSLLEGRMHFAYRFAAVASDIQEAIRMLRNAKDGGLGTYSNKVKKVLKPKAETKSLLEKLKEKIERMSSASEYRESLLSLAQLYCQGYQIDGNILFGKSACRRLSLPCYPFEQERCWLEQPTQSTAIEVSGQRSGLLGKNCSNLYELRYETVLSRDAFYLSEHVIANQKTFPGVGYLEMVYAAAKNLFDVQDESIIRMSHIGWLSPIICEEEETVSIALEETKEDTLKFTIYTQKDETINSQGRVETREREEDFYEDIAAWKEAARSIYEADSFYDRYDRIGMYYGANFRYLKKAYVEDDFVLSYLEMPEEQLLKQNCTLVLGMLDGALQSILGFTISKEEKSETARIPFSMDEVTVYHPCTRKMWALVQQSEHDGKVKKYDICLMDEDGIVCVEMNGYFAMEYRQKEDCETHFLKRKCILGTKLNPDKESQDRVDICIGVKYAPQDVVTLTEADAPESIAKTYCQQAVAIFRQVKKMVSGSYRRKKNLQVVIPKDENGMLYGGLDGLFQSARKENPQFRGKIIEVDRELPSDEISNILALESTDMEPCHVIYQEGNRYLETYQTIKLDAKPVKPWKKGGVYLISGGAGGLGQLFAREIANNSKRSVIILLGRSQMKPETGALIKELQSEGCIVEYRVADVTSLHEMKLVKEELLSQYGVINGIIHCAGTIDDGYMITKNEAAFQTVLEPKVLGITALDEATKEVDLDFFICFSSITGAIGNAGQSDYATANAYMDRYMTKRNRQVAAGKRSGISLSYNWPLWKEGGMQVDEETKKVLKADFGSVPMPNKIGMDVFYGAWSKAQEENGQMDHIICMYGVESKLRNVILKLTSETESTADKIEDAYQIGTFGEMWEEESYRESSSNWKTMVCLAEDNSLKQVMQSECELLGGNVELVWVFCSGEYEKHTRYEYTLDYEQKEDYVQVFKEIKQDFGKIDRIVYLNPLNNKIFLQNTCGILFLLQALNAVNLQQCFVLLAGWYENEVERAYAESWIGMERSVAITSLNIEIAVILGNQKKMDYGTFLHHMLCECNHVKPTSVWFDGKKRLVQKMQEIDIPMQLNNTRFREQGIYLITGGMGGLGILFAKYLAKQYHGRIVLTGRRDLSAVAEQLTLMRESGMNVLYVQADVSSYEQMHHAVELVKQKFGAIHGVIHAAGLPEGKNIVEKSYEEYQKVQQPKVHGMLTLEKVLCGEDLDFLCCFSSSSAVLGDFGSFDYAIGNRFMGSYGRYLNQQDEWKDKVFVIEWPLWKEGGMGFTSSQSEHMYLLATGQETLETEDGIQMLESILFSNYKDCLVMYGIREKIERMLGITGKIGQKEPTLVQEKTQQEKSISAPIKWEQDGFIERTEKVVQEVKQERNVDNGQRLKAEVVKIIKGIFYKVLKIAENRINIEDSMEVYGLNSIIIMDLTKELEVVFGSLSKTLFYEYPTIDALASYFVESYEELLTSRFASEKANRMENRVQKAGKNAIQSKEEMQKPERRIRRRNKNAVPIKQAAEKQSIPQTRAIIREEQDIAIIGLSGRYPKSKDMQEFWKNLKSGRDCIEEVPEDRWDNETYRDAMGAKKTFSQYGGFIEEVEQFDPLFFHISPREAEKTDPQERLFLESVYHAMEDAGYTRKDMERIGNVGVYVGSMYSEYQYYGVEEQMKGNMVAYTGTLSSIANRVSYYLNIHGPSLAVDTMCSSSLTAVYLACEEIRRGRCDMMIAGGVNLSIHPNKYVMLAQNNFSSSSGRCISFGEGGDGYVPSEGVGAIILKSLSKAEADGDHIYGVIKAVEANHGGKTSGYSVPNPTAQTDVIVRAIESARINPETITYVEAHGTGTSLGDPIEVTALNNAFRKYTDKTGICMLGSVKSNIGHCEGAAGISALSKVLLQMKHQQIVPSIHSNPQNPYINFQETPFEVPQELKQWKRVVMEQDGEQIEYPLRAGISAFGAGGSNVHLIVEEYKEQENRLEEHGTYGIVISAKTEGQVKQISSELLEWIRNGTYKEADLPSIAYTLQIGREAMEYRVAFCVDSLHELEEKLDAYGNADAPEQIAITGSGRKENRELERLFSPEEVAYIYAKWVENGRVDKLLECWVKGMKIDWNMLYQAEKPHRISLPVYPFVKQRCWVETKREWIIPKTEKPSDETKEILFAEEKWVPYKVTEQLSTHFVASDNILWIVNDDTDVEKIRSYIEEQELAGQFTFARRGLRYQKEKDQTISIHFADSQTVTECMEKLNKENGKFTHVLYWGTDSHEFGEEQLEELGFLYKALHQCKNEVASIVVAGRYQTKEKLCCMDALTGYAKTTKMLMPKTVVRMVFAKQATLTTKQLIAVTINQCMANENRSLRKDAEGWKTSQIEEVLNDAGTMEIKEQGVYLVTGGLGGIGTVITEWLLKTYHAHVVLTGRSLTKEKQERLDVLSKNTPGIVRFYQADVLKENEMYNALQFAKDQFGMINGIFHIAGLEGKSKLFDSSDQEFRDVLAPKVEGTRVLNRVCKDESLDLICYFSSTAAILGDFGDCAYSVGNRYMMNVAQNQSIGSQVRKVVVINWPLWRDGGMGHANDTAMEMYLKSSGLNFLEKKDAIWCMEQIIRQDRVSQIVFAGKRNRIEQLFGQAKTEKVTANVVPKQVMKEKKRTTAQWVQPSEQEWKQTLLEELQMMVSRLLKIEPEKIGYHVLLADYGFDSITLAEFADMIQEKYGITVMPDIFFSYPTLLKFRDWISKEHKEVFEAIQIESASDVIEMEETVATREVSKADVEEVKEIKKIQQPKAKFPKQEEEMENDSIAIVGISGRFPGAKTTDALWEILKQGQIKVEPVSEERPSWHGDGRVRRMGALTGIHEFDPLFFEISPSEAEQMDPRQRILLEESWKALEMAGFGEKLLEKEDIGVFVGAEDSTFGMVTNYAGNITANHNAMLAARLAYFLDMKGPNMTINTACSSGLSAVHEACLSIRNHECDAAVAAGVNIFFTPGSYDKMEDAGMTSPSQNCYAFDNRADGMVPGEAVAVVVLKRLSQARKDRNTILAVIKGSGINYDGKTNGITAPSAPSQVKLLKSVYERYQVNPDDISLVMAHGTGTKLGDPIEINALTEVFKTYTNRKQYCAIASIKSNLGHSLAASGVASLIAVVLALQNEMIPPQVNCEEESPYIDWKNSPFYINRKGKEWKDQKTKRMATVSAFGMGGTNVHMVIESAPQFQPDKICQEERVWLLPVSAKSQEALEQNCSCLADYLEEHMQSLSLSDISFTLLEGRKHFRYRRGILASGIEEAIASLRNSEKYTDQVIEANVSRKFLAKPEDLQKIRELERDYAVEREKESCKEILRALGTFYTMGYTIDGEAVFLNSPVKRILLPAYSFVRGVYITESEWDCIPKQETVEKEVESVTLYLGVMNPPEDGIVLGEYIEADKGYESPQEYKEKLSQILEAVLGEEETNPCELHIIAPLGKAGERYQDAELMLQEMKERHPEWNGRMHYVPVDSTREELLKIEKETERGNSR